MITTLDGRRIESETDSTTTLHGAIDEARRDCPPENLIVTVRLNGRELVDAELEAMLDRALHTEDQVDLVSTNRRELAALALRDAAEAIERSGSDAERIADGLQGGVTEGGASEVVALFKAWTAANETVSQCCQLLDEDLTERRHNERSVREYLAELADRLRELRDALEAGDMVLLGDIVRYELPELSRQWGELLRALAEEIAPLETNRATPAEPPAI